MEEYRVIIKLRVREDGTGGKEYEFELIELKGGNEEITVEEIQEILEEIQLVDRLSEGEVLLLCPLCAKTLRRVERDDLESIKYRCDECGQTFKFHKDGTVKFLVWE